MQKSGTARSRSRFSFGGTGVILRRLADADVNRGPRPSSRRDVHPRVSRAVAPGVQEHPFAVKEATETEMPAVFEEVAAHDAATIEIARASLPVAIETVLPIAFIVQMPALCVRPAAYCPDCTNAGLVCTTAYSRGVGTTGCSLDCKHHSPGPLLMPEKPVGPPGPPLKLEADPLKPPGSRDEEIPAPPGPPPPPPGPPCPTLVFSFDVVLVCLANSVARLEDNEKSCTSVHRKLAGTLDALDVWLRVKKSGSRLSWHLAQPRDARGAGKLEWT